MNLQGNNARQGHFPVCGAKPCPPYDHNCKQLMCKLQGLDFSIADTLLYLDAYPDCGKAKEYLARLFSEREGVRGALREAGCPPITQYDENGKKYRWVDGPWPWEPEGN